MLTHDLDIDIWEVIDAATGKPFGFSLSIRVLGSAGTASPSTPHTCHGNCDARRDVVRGARSSARRQRTDAELRSEPRRWDIERHRANCARQQDLHPRHHIQANVADVRESPSLMVMQALHRKGAHVSFHDPFIEEVSLNGDKMDRADLGPGIAGTDLVLLLTPHSDYNLGSMPIKRHSCSTRGTHSATMSIAQM